jgi:hypothetical protein
MPAPENVCTENTFSDRSGFVSTCENASMPTMVPISTGSAALGKDILREQPDVQLDIVDGVVAPSEGRLHRSF